MKRTLSTLLLMAAPLFAEVKYLKNFTLIDGSGKAPVANAAMVIDNGRITAVGAAASVKAPAGAQTIDLAGKYVMPGIINLHGHLGNTMGLAQDPKFFTRENVEKNLKLYASYGVTSVISMGSDQDLIFKLREEQRAGRPTYTRIYTAGRGFAGKGGYPTTVPGMKGVPYEVEDTASIAKDVDELAAKKVDLVKMWVDDHLGKEKKIPIDLTQAIIANAHKHHLISAAHVFYLDDAKALVNAGLDGLAHSVRDKDIDQALIDSMKKHGSWQMAPTLARENSVFIYAKNPAWLNDPFFTRGLDAATLATIKSPEYQKKIMADHDYPKYEGFLETAKRNLKKLADSGVKYGFGTDSGPPARFPGYFEHMEMELMVSAGLTPMQVITAATRNSAEFLKAKDLGTLEKGKWADLIVLGKNPLDDIRNSKTLEQVYIAGNKVN